MATKTGHFNNDIQKNSEKTVSAGQRTAKQKTSALCFESLSYRLAAQG